jgi:hypothetical protein
LFIAGGLLHPDSLNYAANLSSIRGMLFSTNLIISSWYFVVWLHKPLLSKAFDNRGYKKNFIIKSTPKSTFLFA